MKEKDIEIDSILKGIPKPKNSNIGIIIQARMGSKRFPGKSMEILKGKPVIENVILNCQNIRPKSKIILAVPDLDESDVLIEKANFLGVDHFAGSENDVLARYYEAAKFFNLDVIVRITGDCPFINPDVCSEVLQLLFFRKLDYCCNCYPVRTYPRGLDCEAFTMDCLEAAHLLADGQTHPGDREHVTPWMQRTEGIRRANVVQAVDASKVNLCVDYPADLERLEMYTFSGVKKIGPQR